MSRSYTISWYSDIDYDQSILEKMSRFIDMYIEDFRFELINDGTMNCATYHIVSKMKLTFDNNETENLFRIMHQHISGVMRREIEDFIVTVEI